MRRPGEIQCAGTAQCLLRQPSPELKPIAALSGGKLGALGQSIRVNALDPGMMPGTGLARTNSAPLRFVWNYILPALTLFQNVNRPVTSGRRLAALASGQMGGPGSMSRWERCSRLPPIAECGQGA